MKIQFEIYSDEQTPDTCCRQLAEGKVCQFLRTGRWGRKYYCKLFGEWDEELEHYGKDAKNLIKPHPKCIKARVQHDTDIVKNFHANMDNWPNIGKNG